MKLPKIIFNNTLAPFGLFLIVIGILLPSDFANGLRPAELELSNPLLLGGQLFKVGLSIVGLWMIVLTWLTSYLNNQEKESPPTHLDRNTLLALTLLMVVTIIIRIYALNSGLWLDEILTYVGYATRPYGEIITTFDSENQHFLYSLLAHTSFVIFGENAWALRLPAALFGIGSILALFYFGLEVTDKKEAFLSAALLSLSYHHIWFSQNARGYSGLLFWTILSSMFLFRGIRMNRAKDWIYFGITAALGAYTHLTMGFVILGQVISVSVVSLFKRDGDKLRKIIGILMGFGTAAILIYLFYAIVLPQIFTTIGSGEQSVVAAWKNPIWTAMELLRGLRIGFTNGFMVVVVLLVTGTGIVSYLIRNPILVGIALIPPIAGAAITILVGHHLWPRFFFFAFGFGALLVIRGIMVIGERIGRLNVIPPKIGSNVGQIGCVVLILLSSFSIPFAYGPKQDYLGALHFVEQNRTENDAVVTVSLAAYPYNNLYRADWLTVTTVDELITIETKSDPTWLVYTFPPVLESVYPDIMTFIEKNYSVVKVFRGTVEGGDIIVCRSNQTNLTIQPLDAGQ